MWYTQNDPLASFVFIYCIIVGKYMLKCVLRVRIKIYVYIYIYIYILFLKTITIVDYVSSANL